MRRLTIFVVAAGLTALLNAGPGTAERQPYPRGFRREFRIAAAPRVYAAVLYLTYDADTIKDADGNVVRLSPTTPGSIRIAAAAPMAWYVSKAKFSGPT